MFIKNLSNKNTVLISIITSLLVVGGLILVKNKSNVNTAGNVKKEVGKGGSKDDVFRAPYDNFVEKVDKSGEYLLFKICEKRENCYLFIADTKGNIEKLPKHSILALSMYQGNDFWLSPDGNHFFYVEGDTISVKKIDTVNNIYSFTGARAVNTYSDSFWVSENSNYNNYDYTGNLLRTMPRELFPWPKPGSDIGAYVRFGPNYKNYPNILAIGVQNSGDGLKYSAWSVNDNNKLSVIVRNEISDYDEDTLSYFGFLPKTPGLLAVDQRSKYILDPDGSKHVLIEEDLKDWYESNYYIDENESYLYYVNEDLFKYDLLNQDQTNIVTSVNVTTRLGDISPSGEFMYIYDYGDDHKLFLLSLENNKIIPFEDLQKIERHSLGVYGWLTAKQLENFLKLSIFN